MKLSLFVGLFLLSALSVLCWKGDRDDEDEDPYTSMDPKKREPSPCEVCKYFVTELANRLAKSAKSKEKIEMGYNFQMQRKKFDYVTSELRLTEALMDPHICENILKYNVHAERGGSNRYAQGQSQTMGVLTGLVNKGVKVELGIPYELWNNPSAEITKMHRACFKLAEDYEDDIEEWYYNHQSKYELKEYICRERYLKGKNSTCLDEVFVPKPEDEGDDDNDDKESKDKPEDKTSMKGDIGKPGQDTQTASTGTVEQAKGGSGSIKTTPQTGTTEKEKTGKVKKDKSGQTEKKRVKKADKKSEKKDRKKIGKTKENKKDQKKDEL